MIRPVNGHILIEPLQHESFIASQKDQYDEIGIVVDLDANSLGYRHGDQIYAAPVHVGDKIYFDSWLAAKYPKNDKEWYWLVKWEDVRAVEYVEPEVSK